MTIPKPQVAVLLAAYNGMQWIEEQLMSIQAQTAVRVSIFISVDLSTDDTYNWCTHYADAHDNVRVLPQVGRLGGAGRNFYRLLNDLDLTGIDYVALADQDDRWFPDKLQRAVEQLQLTSSDAYSSNVTAFWPDGREQLLDKAQPQVAWDYLFEAAGPGCTYVLSAELTVALKRVMQAQWELLQSVTLHDWFIYAFARSQAFKWHIDARPGLHYRQHAANQVGANVGLKPMWSRFSKILDGWWFEQVFLISRLIGHPWGLLARHSVNKRRLLLKMAIQSPHCRRRLRDRVLFCLVCMIAAFKGRFHP
ncbi:glycosyltransferase [Pseudomonas sp. TE3610]